MTSPPGVNRYLGRAEEEGEEAVPDASLLPFRSREEEEKGVEDAERAEEGGEIENACTSLLRRPTQPKKNRTAETLHNLAAAVVCVVAILLLLQPRRQWGGMISLALAYPMLRPLSGVCCCELLKPAYALLLLLS